jgi:hypothetical protein
LLNKLSCGSPCPYIAGGELPCMVGELPCMRGELPCSEVELPCSEVELPCMRGELPCFEVELPCMRGELACVVGELACTFGGELPSVEGELSSVVLGEARCEFVSMLAKQLKRIYKQTWCFVHCVVLFMLRVSVCKPNASWVAWCCRSCGHAPRRWRRQGVCSSFLF